MQRKLSYCAAALICLYGLVANASSLSPIINYILNDDDSIIIGPPPPPPPPPPAQLKGTNLAGAEFGPTPFPATFNTDYTYPNQAEVDYFMAKGMNVFRVPFTWERLQNSKRAQFNSAELSRLEGFVSATTAKGATVLLDPHNYSRYFGQVIGANGANVNKDDFADFWTKLSNEFKDDARVMFGIMNEPHDMSTELWLENANAAIAAIRATGAQNTILVPGNGYTGAWTWSQNFYGTPNATVMQGIIDSGDNYIIEVHQYFDSDGSGQYSGDCVGASAGADRLQGFTDWLNDNNLKGFLGEFGIINTPTCNAAISSALQHMDDNKDVWAGWTYWAAGPWWGDYPLSIEPNNDGSDRPIINQLTPFLP